MAGDARPGLTSWGRRIADGPARLPPLDPAIRWAAGRFGKITGVSASAGPFAGGGSRPAAGARWRDLVAPPDRVPVWSAIRHALETGGQLDVRCRLQLDGEEPRWYHVRAVPLRDGTGRVQGWVGRSEDIHSQMLAEQALREQAMQLRTVFDQSLVGILHRDLNGQVLMVNDRFCELVGRTAAEISRMPPGAFLHPDERSINAAIIAEHARRGQPLEREIRYLRPDGSVVWCALYISFVLDDTGGARSMISIAQDVSARRQAEAELRASEEHHRYTVELNPGMPWTASPDGMIEEVSLRWEEVTGQPREAAMGRGWLLWLHPDDVAPTVAAWQQALRTGEPIDVEYRLNCADGVSRWFRSRARPRRDATGAIVRWYGALEAIDDRKAAEEALRENEQRFRLAVQAAELGVWDYDARTGRRVWSPELRAILGVAPGTAPSTQTALRLTHPDDRAALQALLDDSSDPAQQGFEAVLRIRRDDDGRERWLKAVGWKTFAPDGQMLRALVTLRDVTDERTADERIRWMATHDPLTGLPNRGAFQHELERLIGRVPPQDEPLAVIQIDVDHLKEVNEHLGHDVGDALLCALADRLRRVLPEGAFVARLGSDEFGAVMRVGAGLDLPRLAAAIGAPLRPPSRRASRLLECHASMGAALFPDHGGDAAEVLKAADTALYAAKASGRGSMTLFHPDMRREARRRARMIERARGAIAERRVVPYYQPKVRLDTGAVAGFEALLRWHTGDGRMLSPGGIAAAFEDLELAALLHECMFDRILSDMRSWLDAGLDFGRIAVNASAAQFVHDDFAEQFLARMARHGIAARYVELEVTETVFLGRGAEGVDRALRELAAEGVRIALDDFGTGYASLTHLKSFPVHTIKIDRRFMTGLDDPAGNAAIVEAVVAMGHRLGMETVAEGVERVSQRQFLQHCRCDLGQGFLFGRAIAPEAVPGLVGSWDRQAARD